MWVRIMAVVLAVLLVAACGGGDDGGSDDAADTTIAEQTSDTEATADDESDTTVAADDSSDDAGDDDSGDSGGGIQPGGMVVEPGDASVTADGESLTVTGLLRCIPFSDEEGNLDLTILGDGFELFLYVTPSSHEVSMQGRAIGDGESLAVYSNSAFSFDGGTTYTDDETGEALDAPPIEWSGDRAHGSMVIYDAYGTGASIEVVYDSPVPAEAVDCSL